jgi:hypothetical protein
MTKYAILGFVLMQSMVMVGMDHCENNTPLNRSGSDLSCSMVKREASQELRRQHREIAAAYYYYITPCCHTTKSSDLQRELKPLPQDNYYDGP